MRRADKGGDLLHVAPEQLLQLPPLHTVLRGGKRSGVKRVPVTLAARSTEIGTLELWCVARDGNNRWRLEFNVRDIVKGSDEPAPSASEGAGAVTDIWPEAQVQEAAQLLRATYLPLPSGERGGGEGVEPKELTKSLETALDAPRHAWPTGLCRRLFEFLVEVAEHRRRSPAHFARWYNLVGYCLRPGFGDALDKYRVEQLWKLLHAPPRGDAGRPVARQPEGGAEYWIMWRRVAGGLNAPLQQDLFNRLRRVFCRARGKPASSPRLTS